MIIKLTIGKDILGEIKFENGRTYARGDGHTTVHIDNYTTSSSTFVELPVENEIATLRRKK